MPGDDDATALELLAVEIQLARAVSVIEQPLATTPYERVAVPPPKRCTAFGVTRADLPDGCYVAGVAEASVPAPRSIRRP